MNGKTLGWCVAWLFAGLPLWAHGQCADGALVYQAHVADVGWQAEVCENEVAGVEGVQMEAIKVRWVNPPAGCALTYQAHVADQGWLGWVTEGEQAGTTGESRQLEAVLLKLTGCAGVDIQYRARVAEKGWLDWVENGQMAGTTGESRALEGLQIQLVNPAVAGVCADDACRYELYFYRPGFYLASARLPATGREGLWGMSLEQPLVHVGEINIGTILKEDGEHPAFLAFNLSERVNVAESVALTPYEYSGQAPRVTLRLSRQDEDGARREVMSSTTVNSGEGVVTPVLDPGFYVTEIYSPAGSERGRFGLNLAVNHQQIAGGANFGGWIDSRTGGNGEGFSGFSIGYRNQRMTFKVLHGQHYGDQGASQPEFTVWHQDEQGERTQYFPTQPLTEDVVATVPTPVALPKALPDPPPPSWDVATMGPYVSEPNTQAWLPALSANGGYLAYITPQALTPEDTNQHYDVYLQDLETNTVERVSVTDDNLQMADPYGIENEYRVLQRPAISADGRYVAFVSAADGTGHVVAVYLRDREKRTTTWVSHDVQRDPTRGGGAYPILSADGRYLAFTTLYGLLGEDGETRPRVYFYEVETGQLQATSITGDGFYPMAISDDGRWLVVPRMEDRGVDNNIFSLGLYDRVAGKESIIAELGEVEDGQLYNTLRQSGPDISGDGRWIVFVAKQALVAEDTNGSADVYVYDRVGQTLSRASTADDDAQTQHISGYPAISGDGEWIAFEAFAPVWEDNPENQYSIEPNQLYLRHRASGRTQILARDAQGGARYNYRFMPRFSADGKRVVYAIEGNELVQHALP